MFNFTQSFESWKDLAKFGGKERALKGLPVDYTAWWENEDLNGTDSQIHKATQGEVFHDLLIWSDSFRFFL